MSDNGPLAMTMEDEHKIASMLTRWGHARDSGDWETLAHCFHNDATIHISWISASAKEFVERSRTMIAGRGSSTRTKHLISPPWILLNRGRAFSRCHANLYIRTEIDGHELDLRSWICFFDLLEKRNNVWGIVKRTGVYEKDRMEPVDPRGVPENFFVDMELSQFPASAKFLCYWLQRTGRPPSTIIVSAYSQEERALLEEGEAWIKSA